MNNLKPDRGYVEVDGLRYESNQAIKAIHQNLRIPFRKRAFGELTGYEHLNCTEHGRSDHADALVDGLNAQLYHPKKSAPIRSEWNSDYVLQWSWLRMLIMLLDEAANGLDPEMLRWFGQFSNCEKMASSSSWSRIYWTTTSWPIAFFSARGQDCQTNQYAWESQPNFWRCGRHLSC